MMFMKRGFTILILALVLTTFIVSAQNDIIPEITTEEDSLAKALDIPKGLTIPLRIVFGLEEPISIRILVIHLMLWSLVFFLLAMILKFVPLFKDWIVWPISFIVTSLIAFGGAIKILVELFIINAEIFRAFGGLSVGAIIFTVVVVLALLFIISKISSTARKYMKAFEAERLGERVEEETRESRAVTRGIARAEREAGEE